MRKVLKCIKNVTFLLLSFKKWRNYRGKEVLSPGAATFQLVNMSIHPFEINVILCSVWDRNQHSFRKRFPKALFTMIWITRKKLVSPYSVFASSLRSLSASSKKRFTTSTTNSGLLSSWSCWSWLNWSSKKPFSRKQMQQ